MTVSDSAAPLPDERRAQVVELLRRRGVLRVNELASELDVSAITIRRDIALLASQGLIRRVRGGAALLRRPVAEAPISQAPGDRPPPQPAPDSAEEAKAQVTIGMVVPSLDYYWPDVIRGVREAAAASDTRVVLRGATYQAADERRQLSWLVDSVGVDGLLVAPTTTGEDGEALVRWLQSAEVPVVLVERAAVVGPYQEAMESVVSDHVFGAAMAVRHLAALGHRRIGVITTRESPTTPHVRRGWRQACGELGLGLDDALDADTVDRRDPDWPHELDDLLDECVASGTTALLVHSDPEAISLVERCQERGIRIPDDLAVVAYDDEVAELCDPPLTAVRPPKAAIGRAAFALLADRIADQDAYRPAHRVVIEPRLIVRSSSS
ncbi:substrate-binding domain-containing protein [Microbispora bryophytorum]|uniref:LacI family transcriptional regulator n=1 Tax=Microbispora bryophytorum TaxID=1460882 RepID=A0A8H9LJ52_9ACTN|nr:substrate-binding domain-containing protein [Microbispora bryophytorum]MBD3141017.1 DeoR/GlpR family transcriptional regulator [Microbispora bryophytorum]TQR99912.1 DeoR family transcriptional regulator [Microbispora bryophytorum]GGO26163.1 LacI family transcriptional regulator [Microbispora bryophytorum]